MQVQSRVHRILRHLSQFQSGDPGTLPTGLLSPGEACLGIYENEPGSLRSALIVGDQGIHVHQPDEWTFIAFKDLSSVDVPIPEGKERANVVRITTKDGRSVDVPILGGDEKLRDVFEVSRFLARAREDAATE